MFRRCTKVGWRSPFVKLRLKNQTCCIVASWAILLFKLQSTPRECIIFHSLMNLFIPIFFRLSTFSILAFVGFFQKINFFFFFFTPINLSSSTQRYWFILGSPDIVVLLTPSEYNNIAH